MAKKNNSDVAGTALAGCMLVGLGIGTAFDATNVGVLVGLGVGLLVMAVIRSRSK